LAVVVGSIDDLGRPLVRIAVVGSEDDALCMIDTGFNGEWLVHETDLLRLGLKLVDDASTVELAGGRRVVLRRASGTVIWFGHERLISALVSSDPIRPRREDDPIALIGTELMAKCLVLFDFPRGNIEIEQAE
jgi:predicted aspartyl protease